MKKLLSFNYLVFINYFIFIFILFISYFLLLIILTCIPIERTWLILIRYYYYIINRTQFYQLHFIFDNIFLINLKIL